MPSLDSRGHVGALLGACDQAAKLDAPSVLTDKFIKNLKPKDKPFKHGDGAGLYIEVMPTGSKLWRLKYRIAGREKRLAFGAYPTVSAAQARDLCNTARKQLAQGIDPSEHCQATKQAKADSFQSVADEWLELQTKKLSPVTLNKAKWLLGFVLKYLGSK